MRKNLLTKVGRILEMDIARPDECAHGFLHFLSHTCFCGTSQIANAHATTLHVTKSTLKGLYTDAFEASTSVRQAVSHKN